MKCDGTVDAATKLCHARSYYLTNLTANKVILPKNVTISQANSDIQSQLQRGSQYQVCPTINPVSVKNQS